MACSLPSQPKIRDSREQMGIYIVSFRMELCRN